MKKRLAAVLGTAILLLASIPANTRSAIAETTSSYLVGLRTGASPTALHGAGFTVRQSWANLHPAEVVTDARNLDRLRRNPAVAYVESNSTLSRAAASGSSDEVTWGLRKITAPATWKLGSTGAGIKVCDLDSGIDPNHPEFGGGVIKGAKNFVNDGHPDAADGDGHGTFTAGEIAARSNGTGVVGAAYGAQLYVARILDDSGEGTLSSLIDGVDWCVNTVHARVLNMSFGDTHSSRTAQTLFADIYKQGVLSFAASGNDGDTTASYPAAYPSVIAVGATDTTNRLAGFSSYGSDQELVAPGVNVLSTIPVGTGERTSLTENDTSYATSVVKYSAHGTVSGPLVECGLAADQNSCTSKPSSGSWVAVITRGTTTFAEKVRNVMAQGAKAAVITNNDTANPNDASSFTLGAEGTWIPTVALSYNSGVALRSGGLGTGTAAVQSWDYEYADGTSMASPYAAAAAALAWSANPKLTNTQIRTVLQESAKDLGTKGKDNRFGYGLVQARQSVKLARATKP